MNYLIIIFLLIHGINCMDGGMRARKGQFKYVVSIRRNFVHFCTGAIIHKNFIITAQHCMFSRPVDEIYIYAGLIDYEDPNLKVLTIDKIYTYPTRQAMTAERRISTSYHAHDIALLKLHQELVWTETLGPVRLIEKPHVWSTCDMCVVPGWDAQEECYLFLLFVDAFVLDRSECVSRVGVIFPNHRCVVDDIGDGITYPGDSGTPYICDDKLVGINIRGYAERTRPSIVLDVSPYLSFISEILHDGVNIVEPGEYPYVVSIWRDDNYLCGGTIIDKQRILTAGDCVIGIPKKFLKIAAGRTHLSERDPTVNWLYVDSVEVQRMCSMAVIKLTKPLPTDAHIRKAQLPNPYIRQDRFMNHCQLFRWIPELTQGVGSSRKLVWFSGIVLPQDQCERLDASRGSYQFCAISPYGFPLSDDVDSGTPFVCGGIIYGILLAIPITSAVSSLETVFYRIPTYAD